MAEAALFFKHPPIGEVSFSVQFKEPKGFHSGLMGIAWSYFRDRYPFVSERDELPHEIEMFGVVNQRSAPKFRVLEKPSSPRLLCFDAQEQFAIQFQKDRFIFNWVSKSSDDYPRYPKLKSKFSEELRIFSRFLQDSDLGDPVVDQIELTYVNWISSAERDLAKILNDVPGQDSLPSNLDFENLSFNLKHAIKTVDGQKIGRLHTTVSCPVEREGSSDTMVLRYCARVHPSGQSFDDALSSFDSLRATINDRFDAMTHEDIQKDWHREDEYDQK